VCSDQEDRLARPIDEQLGFAVDKVYRYIKAPKEEWQPFWDQALGQGPPPTEDCDINRSPSGTVDPWVVITSPEAGTVVDKGGSLDVHATGYSTVTDITKMEVYIGGKYVTQATNNPFVSTVTVPASLGNGTHAVRVKVYDVEGRTGEDSVNIIVGDIVSISDPANGAELDLGIPITVEARHYGNSEISSAKLIITGVANKTETMTTSGSGVYTATWTPELLGTYNLQVELNLTGGSKITSSVIIVEVDEAPIPPP